MQHTKRAGGTVTGKAAADHTVPVRLGSMVGGSGTRQERVVEERITANREQAWLSSALSHGLSGTRLA